MELEEGLYNSIKSFVPVPHSFNQRPLVDPGNYHWHICPLHLSICMCFSPFCVIFYRKRNRFVLLMCLLIGLSVWYMLFTEPLFASPNMLFYSIDYRSSHSSGNRDFVSVPGIKKDAKAKDLTKD